MRREVLCVNVLAIMLLSSMCIFAQNMEKNPQKEENFYTKSLHFTNKGFEYLYAKEQGGIERITSLPITEMGCMKAKCHVQTCDTCHKKEVNGKSVYSVEPSIAETACNKCHPVDKDDPDVHFRKGMKCMDCHTVREIHGDGTAYNTYMQAGFFDTSCEKCHASISKSISHTVHNGKLDCNPCHVKDFPACLNCHIDTRLKESKDVQIQLKNIFFLVNHDRKVTLANFLTYVYQNKTMITFAPYFPHSIKKEGRKCEECHNTSIVKNIKKNKFFPVTWANGEIKNVEGMIPVLEGMKWNIVFLNYENGKWFPLQNPAEPLLNYSGWCSPLTHEQFTKLEKAQK